MQLYNLSRSVFLTHPSEELREGEIFMDKSFNNIGYIAANSLW